MKQLLFSLLALTALAGCSKSETTPEIDDNAPVAIQLKSGIGVTSRGTVTDGAIGTGDDVTAQIEFWETKTTPTYTDTPTWQRTASVKSGADAAKLTFNSLVYYNGDDAVKSFIKGWYPQIASNAGVVTIPNDAGTVDVVLSNEVSGSKKTVVDSELVFDHQTAQLIFKVLKGTGLTADTKIKSITVKGAKVPTKITLGATDVVTYESKGNLSVPNLTPAIIDAEAVAGKPLMIESVADNSTDNTPLTLDIVTELNGEDITYTGVKFETKDNKILKGTAYTVTLTFKQNGIEPSAKITPWAEATGKGDVI